MQDAAVHRATSRQRVLSRGHCPALHTACPHAPQRPVIVSRTHTPCCGNTVPTARPGQSGHRVSCCRWPLHTEHPHALSHLTFQAQMWRLGTRKASLLKRQVKKNNFTRGTTGPQIEFSLKPAAAEHELTEQGNAEPGHHRSAPERPSALPGAHAGRRLANRERCRVTRTRLEREWSLSTPRLARGDPALPTGCWCPNHVTNPHLASTCKGHRQCHFVFPPVT